MIDYPYKTAKATADELVAILKPLCTFIEIGGSIRREKPRIGDIEIIAQYDDLNRFALALYSTFKVGMKRESRQVKFAHNSIKVDLFIPQPDDLQRQFVIRTGSADFVYKNIATRWMKLGWVGCKDGLRRRSECVMKGDKFMGYTTDKPTLPPVWKTEKEFFQFLSIPYLEPQYRY